MITTEEIVKSQKSSIDVATGFAAKSFEGIEQLIELNISAFKAALAEAAETTKAALSIKDAQELIALQQGLLQPAQEKATEYSRSMYEIATTTGAELKRIAEAQTADAQAKLMSSIDAAVKSAPYGTESGVAFIKSAIAAATNAMETAQKTAMQAAEAAEESFQSVTKSVARASQTGAKSKRA
jgi:phasin family protein